MIRSMIKGLIGLGCDHDMEPWAKNPSDDCEEISTCRRCGFSERRESHDWDETGRNALGWDGGDYHSGKGQYWYQVDYTCSKCGRTKSEEAT